MTLQSCAHEADRQCGENWINDPSPGLHRTLQPPGLLTTLVLTDSQIQKLTERTFKLSGRRTWSKRRLSYRLLAIRRVRRVSVVTARLSVVTASVLG